MRSLFPQFSTARFQLPRWDGWTVGTLLIAFILSLPIWVVLSSVFVDARSIWQHLASTVLNTYITNSLGLMLGVGIGTATIGISTAWLVTLCRFPGQRLFESALLLPLAAPAYILAYTYTELLEFYGPIQTQLRQWFGWETVQDYWFPNVRSLPGAIAMLTLVLYPYVYLLARSAFLTQSSILLEASRNLGYNPWGSFWRVALPLARPAIVAGLSLALMETLNDLGTVEFFSVPTFTTGIYRTWFGMGERLAASQLAALLLVFVFGLIVLERISRQQQRYYQSAGKRGRAVSGYTLSGWHSLLAILVCGIPILLGFLVPAGVLMQMVRVASSSPGTDSRADTDFPSAVGSTEAIMQNTSDRFWDFAKHSLLLALLTAAIAILISVFLAYGQRLRPANRGATRVATSGYAVPGAVIAVGVLVPLGQFDNTLDAWSRSTFGVSTGLLLSGTIAALVFAYLVRFLAVGFGPVESSLEQIEPSLDDAARSLGCGKISTLQKVHLPLMRSGLLTGLILVFVDVMKELPATLIVRPFNFDTLAVRVYNLASDERLAEAAVPALAIVAVGLLPVVLLNWQMTQGDRR
ncbi:iron ABC transporter permease [Pleurocapsales cyanobacterium LEGE 06147]|nr:iron ABC transporter permease [Pleurocapsales cyanobacterium LEGE 06147]